MAFLPARALHRIGRLETLHTGLVVPQALRPVATRRYLGRRAAQLIPREIPHRMLRAHPSLFLISRLRGRLASASRGSDVFDELMARELKHIASRCHSPFVSGPPGGSLELFAGRDLRIMEQFAPPTVIEKRILSEEMARFPGWMATSFSQERRWDQRMLDEWQLADAVWAPTQAVADACRSLGAAREILHVIPYPIPAVPGEFSRLHEPRASRQPLRVVFAGTLDLYKGVQYIYEALATAPPNVELHVFGPSSLTEEAAARLRTVATVHGPVPRQTLLAAFSAADALLFPSLSEGTALVTLEATATGLPVIATEESGAPGNALKIPARDPGAIREALTHLADDRSRLQEMSAASLAVSRERTEDSFCLALAELVEGLLAGSTFSPPVAARPPRD